MTAIPKFKVPFRHREGDGPRRKKSSFGEYVPLVTLIIGFLLIGLGWNGAASVDFTQGQIPYLISGGLIGLGMVFFSAAALIVQVMKRGQAQQNAELAAIHRTLERLAGTISLQGNGEVTNGELVVAGSSSFHLPNCRTVGGRTNMPRIPREEAVSEGLEPCRICNP